MSQCTCAECGLKFKSVTGFDEHRTGDHALDTGPNRRRCLTVEELMRPREKTGKPTLVQSGDYWVTELRATA